MNLATDDQVDTILELHMERCRLYVRKDAVCPLIPAYKDLEITKDPEDGILGLTEEEAAKLIKWFKETV